MTFFEPRPLPEDHTPAPWGPPLWDRPSEGTFGAFLPVGEIVARGPNLVVSLDHLRVYPNGFVVELLILVRPDFVRREGPRLGLHRPNRWPRVGIRFSDGRTAGRENPDLSPFDVPKDNAGVPSVPIVRPTGGGGGGGAFRLGVWVFPLPPPGPMDVYVQVSELPEAHVTIDGALVRETARRAKVIWD